MQFLKQFKSRTPESVELEFTLAGIGSRTLALVIDYLCWSIALLSLLLLSVLLFSAIPAIGGVQKWVLAIQILLFFVVYVGYFIFFETLWRGQTPGKRYAKIRVIRDDGRNAGLQQAIMRSLLRLIDDSLFIGLILVLFTKQEKRLGDWVAGTVVIQEGRSNSSTAPEQSIAPAAQNLVPEIMATGQIGALTPDDFAIVRRYLQRYPALTPEAQGTVSQQLAAQIVEIIKLPDTALTKNPHLFIQAIYLVYQQQFRS
jgi:uncharacterized RDD family membrane protein YckC